METFSVEQHLRAEGGLFAQLGPALALEQALRQLQLAACWSPSRNDREGTSSLQGTHHTYTQNVGGVPACICQGVGMSGIVDRKLGCRDLSGTEAVVTSEVQGLEKQGATGQTLVGVKMVPLLGGHCLLGASLN